MDNEESKIEKSEEAVKGIETDLKELLEENLEYAQKIHKIVKRIRYYIWWQTFMSFLWFILIVGPIILAILFLPPYLKQVSDVYKNITGVGKTADDLGGVLGGGKEDSIKGIIEQLKK